MNIEGLSEQEFWSKVDKKEEDECWPWLGERQGAGETYGRFKRHGKRQYAHRLSYLFHYKEDPGSFFVCHKCDNPICCNPHHLWLGTDGDNSKDKINKGRNPKGSKHGLSVLDEQKVREIVDILKENKLSFLEIGSIYGVSKETISGIKNGSRWVHITGGKIQHKRIMTKLNCEDVIIVKQLLGSGINRFEIARRFCVNQTTIYDIEQGRTWKQIQ